MIRHTLANQKRRADVIKVVKLGGSLADGADYIGCVKDVVYRYLRGHAGFARQVASARIEAKLRHVQKIATGQDGWKASAFFLERRYPREWAKRERLDVKIDHQRSEKIQLIVQQLETDPDARNAALDLARRIRELPAPADQSRPD